jgi:hypothetical protein
MGQVEFPTRDEQPCADYSPKVERFSYSIHSAKYSVNRRSALNQNSGGLILTSRHVFTHPERREIYASAFWESDPYRATNISTLRHISDKPVYAKA